MPVVVDFKTDAVESREDVELRAEVHAAQGRAYCAAVRSALDLPRTPAFELWFLAAPSSDLAVRRFEQGELG